VMNLNPMTFCATPWRLPQEADSADAEDSVRNRVDRGPV
jgi:hypothetical protein